MRGVIIRTLVLLAVTIQVRTQYIDFFQSFSSFLQPPTTRRNDVTKRPTHKQTHKATYQDAIYFETDDFIKQRQTTGTVDLFTTTVKPKRKKPKTTTRSWFHENFNNNERTTEYNQYNNNNNRRPDNENNNRRPDNENNNRRPDNENDNRRKDNNSNNVYNYEVVRPTERPVFSSFNVAQKPDTRPVVQSHTTQKPISRPVFQSHTTQKPISRPIHQSFTTLNPLLNRPGVRPAVVDTNRPPITNRPVTRPYDRPVTSSRPDDEADIDVDVGLDEDEMSEAEKRRFYSIAEQKCDEYKSLNTKKLVALPLATDQNSPGVELNVSSCTPVNIPLIIGGKSVSITEYPHMGLLGWKNLQSSGYSWKCGGTLISEQFVLTAGHCTYHDKDYNVVSGPPQAVQLGSTYIDGQDSTVVTISTVIRHPKYKLRRSYYDVALVKLTTTVKFSDSISPACLGVPPPVGNRIVATGWGRTEFGGDSSPELRSVSIPVWDMAECRDVWGTSLKLPQGPSEASQVCAGERSGGRDTCQGDSGGPAQIQDGCIWRVVAVTSLGRSCGAAETPALYARIPRAFIASQVFSNVKVNDNRPNNSNNGNNNVNNGNNNNGDRYNSGSNNANNWNSGNGYNNQNNNNGYNQNTNSNQGSNWNSNTQSSGSNYQGVNRPGNHQIIGNSNGGTNVNRGEIVRPGNYQNSNNNRGTTAGVNYFVTSQTSGNRNPDIRPGNHQIISNNNDYNNAGSTYFVTSQSSGNNRDDSRLGNHQTIENNNNRGNGGNNYFVTSHTSGNSETSRLGNHQTVSDNQNNNAGSYFSTSQTSGNREVPSLGNHQNVNNNNRYSDSQNSGSSHDVNYERPGNYENGNQNRNIYERDTNTGINNNNKSDRNNYYYNNEQNNSPPNYGTTVISFNYNPNNNGYNQNNNRDFPVANRPWW